jgi:uncharacterized repeat protein (TIGR03847 family)
VPQSFELSDPDRVTFGTIGPVGERMFLLQARQESWFVTLKLEKVQVAELCRVLGRLLRDLDAPAELPGGPSLELEPFFEPDFVIRALRVGYDEIGDRVVLLCAENDDSDESDEPDEFGEPDTESSSAKLSMTREQALALAIRGTELVEAGRAPCPRCGYPLDPRGHVCPRMNGNQPPLI